MPTKKRIYVKRAQIEKAKELYDRHNTCQDCVLAIAFQDAFNNPKISVGLCRAFDESVTSRNPISLPPKALEIMKLFDAGPTMWHLLKPTQFTIEIP